MNRVRASRVRPGLALSLAARGLVRDPSSSTIAAGVLALGIALPATFFSFLVGAIRTLPVPDGARVVRVEVVQPSRDGRALPVTGADLEALRGSAGLQGLGGFRVFLGTLLDPDRTASRVSAAALTADVLPLLRVHPVLGRIPAEGETGAVLLGQELWRELYDSDPGVLGRVVELDGELRAVAGVLPEGFGFPFKQNAWVILDPAADPEASLELVGRLADGAEPEGATAELRPRWLRRDAVREASLAGGVLTVRPYTRGRGEAGEAVAFGGLVLVALCLLLIACANVANLQLVRATERVRALAVQAALGAGRLQIGAQLLLESLLVALVGGGLGLALAVQAVGIVQRTLSAEHFGYFWMRMAVDGPVLTFTAVLVAGTALAAGILPVVRVARVDVHAVLKEEGAASAVGGGGRWSRAFVTAQLALSCGAVVAAALTGRALAGSSDFGGELPTGEVLVAGVDLAGAPGREEILGDALSSAPGVRAAALALGAPGYGERHGDVEVAGTEPQPGARTLWNAVGPDYLDVLGIEIRAGRGFSAADAAGAAPVAVVSESFARRWWPDAPALGGAVRLPSADSTVWFTVVGIVEDVSLGDGPSSRTDRVLVPLAQVPAGQAMLLLRSAGDAAALAPMLREVVADVDPRLALWDVRTLEDAYAYLIRVPRALATLALVGGSAGLIVAVVGLYGLLAFRVRQRRREMAVRLALGADATRLSRDVMALALRQVLPAVAVGLAAAWVAAPVLRILLLGGDPRDTATYLAVGLGFVLSGVGAAVVPAIRAGRVDPAPILRGD